MVALLVDGVYHSCIATTRTVAPREQLAFDYGGAYWARRGGCCEPAVCGDRCGEWVSISEQLGT
jgi:hypothetical protein